MGKLRRKVLKTLADAYRDANDFPYLSFKAIMKRSGLGRVDVANECRALKREGLAEYLGGLITAEGAFYGAGYAITEAGRNVLEAEQK